MVQRTLGGLFGVFVGKGIRDHVIINGLAGSRVVTRSRKPESCWEQGLERRPDLCVDTPRVSYGSDMQVEEGTGCGNHGLPFGGAVQAAELSLGAEGISVSLKVSHPRFRAREGMLFCVED